jgi:SAM-dependent methyltransferase
MKYHDFGRYPRILDIGGNSGEFALQICRRYPRVSATVFDLPLVCDIGLEHIRSEAEADRISFVKGNALTDPLPEGFDLISFKSMLHDWPEKEAKQFILKASQSLEPGGTLLIFERGPLEVRQRTLPYSMIPFLLFFRSFRSPMIYEEQLKDLDFQNIRVEKIDLETPFYLVTARKKSNE